MIQQNRLKNISAINHKANNPLKLIILQVQGFRFKEIQKFKWLTINYVKTHMYTKTISAVLQRVYVKVSALF